MESPPKTIYLQWKDDDGDPLEEITWCDDKIYNHDAEYRYFPGVIDVEEYYQDDSA